MACVTLRIHISKDPRNAGFSLDREFIQAYQLRPMTHTIALQRIATGFFPREMPDEPEEAGIPVGESVPA